MRQRLLQLTLSVLFLTACADKAIAPYPVSEPSAQVDAAMGPGDLFEVRVFGEADLTGLYQVGADGTFTFPLIGKVEAKGRSGSAIEKELRDRLADGYMKNPQVSVLVRESRSKKVTIFGQVKQPGTFGFTDNMSIIDAVSKAGGFTQQARKNAVHVARKDGQATANIIVAVEDIGKGRAPNFYLRPDDVIFVPERPF